MGLLSRLEGSLLLERPAVPVRVAKEREPEAGQPRTAQHLDLAHVDAPPDERLPGGVDVRDHQLEALHGARRHLGEAGADHDRASRAGRRELDDPHVVAHLVVAVEIEAGLLGVEGLGAIHVGDRDLNHLEPEVHGRLRHARCSARRSNELAIPAWAAPRISSVVWIVVWTTISVRPSPRSVRVRTLTAPSCHASSAGSSNTNRSGSTTSRYTPATVISGLPSSPGPPSSETDVTRNVPPGLTSIVTDARIVPRGPHQCASCSGSVHAFHTSSRGASKTRVMVISCARTPSAIGGSLLPLAPEARPLAPLQGLGDGLGGDGKRLRGLFHRGPALREPRQDGAAGGIRERRER